MFWVGLPLVEVYAVCCGGFLLAGELSACLLVCSYCECFANGEFCNDCNCCNCFNNLQHEEERSRAVKACLDRNPHAFHPKIGESDLRKLYREMFVDDVTVLRVHNFICDYNNLLVA